MELVTTYICECTGRNYCTKTKLAQHRKTKVHNQWETNTELRDLKIGLTKRDNKILELETDKRNLQELNLMLMKKIIPSH